MCRQVTCRRCGNATWSGCGQHVSQVMAGVLRMIEQGRDCKDIVTQLVAVNHALDRAGFAIIASSLTQCLAGPDGAESADAQSLEKLFLSLA